jgi:hypothetical protein
MAAALLFGYVVTHRVHVAPPVPAPAPLPTPTGLPQLTGTPADGPAGLRVLVSGRYPQVVEMSSGHATAIRDLDLTPGDRVRLHAVPAGTVATVTGPGRSRATSLLLGATGPVPLGDDVDVVPAVPGRDLYVAGYGSPGTTVRILDPTGAVRGTWSRPGRLTPLRDTAAGLVATLTGALPGTELRLLDPRTGAERRRLATGRIVVAVGPTTVAHVAGSCAAACPVAVTTLATGATREYAVPAGTPGGGAFSPDGRWLALAVPGQYRNGRLTVVPGFAEVADLRTGAVTAVPGVRTAADHEPDVSWFGDTLVLAVWTPQRGRLALWTPTRPGPLRILRSEPPGDDTFSTATVLP